MNGDDLCQFSHSSLDCPEIDSIQGTTHSTQGVPSERFSSDKEREEEWKKTLDELKKAFEELENLNASRAKSRQSQPNTKTENARGRKTSSSFVTSRTLPKRMRQSSSTTRVSVMRKKIATAKINESTERPIQQNSIQIHQEAPTAPELEMAQTFQQQQLPPQLLLHLQQQQTTSRTSSMPTTQQEQSVQAPTALPELEMAQTFQQQLLQQHQLPPQLQLHLQQQQTTQTTSRTSSIPTTQQEQSVQAPTAPHELEMAQTFQQQLLQQQQLPPQLLLHLQQQQTTQTTSRTSSIPTTQQEQSVPLQNFSWSEIAQLHLQYTLYFYNILTSRQGHFPSPVPTTINDNSEMNNPNHQQFPTALVAPWEPEILNRVFNAEGTPMVEPGIIRIQGNEGLPCDRGDGAPSVPVGNQKVADLQKMCTLVKPDMSL